MATPFYHALCYDENKHNHIYSFKNPEPKSQPVRNQPGLQCAIESEINSLLASVGSPPSEQEPLLNVHDKNNQNNQQNEENDESTPEAPLKPEV